MTTNAVQQNKQSQAQPLNDTPKLDASGKLLLAALKKTNSGSLLLRLPSGECLSFAGNAPGPQAELRVIREEAFAKAMHQGQTGFADAYIDGDIETPDLAALITFFLLNFDAVEKHFYGKAFHLLWLKLRYKMQRNTKKGSRKNILSHYDLGNDFYKLWLDKSMTYSGALFDGEENRSLEEAQRAKYMRILGRLDAKPGAHILEIGCGWGGFAEVAAEKGLRVSGITISEQQAEYARARLAAHPQARDLVDIKLMDYRDVTGTYDYIVSIGMFEHVGEKFWGAYFKTVRQRLKPDGKAVVQAIRLREDVYKESYGKPGFIETYIFPGGMLPCESRFLAEARRGGLACTDMFTFGLDYKRTLENWLVRFEAKIDAVKTLGYDEKFIRLWRFYLCSCISAFGTQRTNLMQAELVPSGTPA